MMKMNSGLEDVIREYMEEFNMNEKEVQHIIYKIIISAKGYDLMHDMFNKDK